MGKLTDIAVKEVRWGTDRFEYRSPIKFGGRIVTDVVLSRVEVDVETRNGHAATGYGAMPVGNVWAWPTAELKNETTLEGMLKFVQRAVKLAEESSEYGHPLELTEKLHDQHAPLSNSVEQELSLVESIPRLASLVANSPIDAAIHDAYGRVHGRSSYDLLGSDFVNSDLSHFLDERFVGEYLDRYTLREPKPSMPLYHLVGALDPISPDEVEKPVGDGLPETLADWIRVEGLTHLKIKLAGDDLDWDVARVRSIETTAATVQAKRGCHAWHYSLDFNERCLDEDYVLEFLNRVQEVAPAALARVQYIEQPTHRDLNRKPEITMHRVARLKPVVIDESLIDYQSLLTAQRLGYSGVALKACKGHSEALLMGAAAQKFGLFLCVQDLTCIGASFLHSSSIAARLPSVAAIEGNGRQYCPAGNAAWSNEFPGMFQIKDGTVGTAELNDIGLGYRSLDASLG